MKIAIIGCGLIGRKRALALGKEDEVVACADVNETIGNQFAADFSCQYIKDYSELLNKIDCDTVIVAVTNKFIEPIVIESLKKGKHVISEKPLGRNYNEAKKMAETLKTVRNETKNFLQFKTGFNHRFHPAVWKAKELCDNNKIGKIINIRGRYGHGGRPGMEKEWRASKDLCGGGELLDQGVHLIDLIRWFGGEFSEVFAKVETKFWDMEVEDNAFAIIRNMSDITVSMHVSWTNWKNIFSFEIFGTGGYMKIEGLGGSYAEETLEIGIRNEKGGRPEVSIIEFPTEDISWKEEWNEFKKSVIEKRECIGNWYDGLKANEIIQAMYISSMRNQPFKFSDVGDSF